MSFDRAAHIEAARVKAEAESAKVIRQAENEAAIAEVLGVVPYMVHTHRLYGTAGTVALKTWERYHSIRDARRIVSPAEVIRLAEQWPGVAMARVRWGGSLGFMPWQHWETVIQPGEESRNATATAEPISPCMVRFDYGDSVKVEWTAQLPGDLGLWQLGVEVTGQGVGRVNVERGGMESWPTEARPIKRCELHIAKSLESVYRDLPAGDPLAIANGMPDGGRLHTAQARQQRYASGSPTSVNPHVLYWQDCAPDDYPSTVADVVRSIWPGRLCKVCGWPVADSSKHTTDSRRAAEDAAREYKSGYELHVAAEVADATRGED